MRPASLPVLAASGNKYYVQVIKVLVVLVEISCLVDDDPIAQF